MSSAVEERPPWSLGWFAERCERLAQWAEAAQLREGERAKSRANPPDKVDETWKLYAASMRDAAQLARDLADEVAASVLAGVAAESARVRLAEQLQQRWWDARAKGAPAHASWWAYYEAWQWAT